VDVQEFMAVTIGGLVLIVVLVGLAWESARINQKRVMRRIAELEERLLGPPKRDDRSPH
jgi:hypothetical protein